MAALVNHREDRFPKLCREYSYPIDRCYTSLKKALARRDAQGVIITIPTEYHYRYTREALLAGKHVLVEKPLTATLAETRRLLVLAKEKHRLISMVSQHRYTPRMKEIKKYCGPTPYLFRSHPSKPPGELLP